MPNFFKKIFPKKPDSREQLDIDKFIEAISVIARINYILISSFEGFISFKEKEVLTLLRNILIDSIDIDTSLVNFNKLIEDFCSNPNPLKQKFSNYNASKSEINAKYFNKKNYEILFGNRSHPGIYSNFGILLKPFIREKNISSKLLYKEQTFLENYKNISLNKEEITTLFSANPAGIVELKENYTTDPVLPALFFYKNELPYIQEAQGSHASAHEVFKVGIDDSLYLYFRLKLNCTEDPRKEHEWDYINYDTLFIKKFREHDLSLSDFVKDRVTGYLDCFYSVVYRSILGQRVCLTAPIFEQKNEIFSYFHGTASVGLPDFTDMKKLYKNGENVDKILGFDSLVMCCLLLQENDFHIKNYGISKLYGKQVFAKIDHNYSIHLEENNYEYEGFGLEMFRKNDPMRSDFLKKCTKVMRFSPFHTGHARYVAHHLRRAWNKTLYNVDKKTTATKSKLIEFINNKTRENYEYTTLERALFMIKIYNLDMLVINGRLDLLIKEFKTNMEMVVKYNDAVKARFKKKFGTERIWSPRLEHEIITLKKIIEQHEKHKEIINKRISEFKSILKGNSYQKIMNIVPECDIPLKVFNHNLEANADKYQDYSIGNVILNQQKAAERIENWNFLEDIYLGSGSERKDMLGVYVEHYSEDDQNDELFQDLYKNLEHNNHDIYNYWSKKQVRTFFSPEGIRCLHRGIISKSSTEERERFIRSLIDFLNKNHSKGKALVLRREETISMAQLVGDTSLYLGALREENNDMNFRNAVAIESHKVYEHLKWKTRVHLVVGGPSGAGKSFCSDLIFKYLSREQEYVQGSYARGEITQITNPKISIRNTGMKNDFGTKDFNKFMQINPRAHGEIITNVVAVDGGIGRKISQIRKLVLQCALALGYKGISDLEKVTKKELNVKGHIRKAALASPRKTHLVEPLTFTNPEYQLHLSKFVNHTDRKFTVFAMVYQPKEKVRENGNKRAWYKVKDLNKEEGFTWKNIEVNIDTDSICESKAYEDHYNAGLECSKRALEHYSKQEQGLVVKLENPGILGKQLQIVVEAKGLDGYFSEEERSDQLHAALLERRGVRRPAPEIKRKSSLVEPANKDEASGWNGEFY